jgi:hypothetical protein
MAAYMAAKNGALHKVYSKLEAGTYIKIYDRYRLPELAFTELEMCGCCYVEGLLGLYYVKQDSLFGDDSNINPTVDGVHPTDLGHYRVCALFSIFIHFAVI